MELIKGCEDEKGLPPVQHAGQNKYKTFREKKRKKHRTNAKPTWKLAVIKPLKWSKQMMHCKKQFESDPKVNIGRSLISKRRLDYPNT